MVQRDLNIAKNFRENGYITPIDILSKNEVNELQKNYCDYENKVQVNGVIGGDYRYQVHKLVTWADQLVRHPKIVKVVSEILGTDNIIAWSSDLNIKKKRSLGFYSWHQDSTYCGFTHPEKFVTVWLAITPATRENGCLNFLPSTHQKQLKHNLTDNKNNMLSAGQTVVEDLIQRKLPYAFEAVLKPGQVSIHSSLTVHGSGPNQSNEKRVGLAIRYLAGDIKRRYYLCKEPVTLVQGEILDDCFEEWEPCKESFSEKAFKDHRLIMEKAKLNYFQYQNRRDNEFKDQIV